MSCLRWGYGEYGPKAEWSRYPIRTQPVGRRPYCCQQSILAPAAKSPGSARRDAWIGRGRHTVNQHLEPPRGHSLFAIDTHVHSYSIFDPVLMFRAAEDHVVSESARTGVEVNALLLCFTDGPEGGALETWQKACAVQRRDITLPVRPTEEVSAYRVDGLRLPVFLIRGKQMVSMEGLEVLAIGVAPPWSDRSLTLIELVDRINDAGGYPVVPWGFGKWWGGRCATIRTLVERSTPTPFALGDNGGRPAFWPRPRLFDVAAAHGVPVLPGSDPLPLAGEEITVGRCLALGRGDFDPRRPWSSLSRALRNRDVVTWVRAGREEAIRFFRNQIAMQLRTWTGRNRHISRG